MLRLVLSLKKGNSMKNVQSHRLFIIFLIVYLGFLIHHAVHEISLWMFLGIVVALFAHARRNILTLLLLFSHMAIEWFEWGSGQIVLLALLGNLLHAGMDFTFLHHEIKVHLKKSPVLILSGVFFILIFIFSITSQVEVSGEILESIHPFVLGGVVGCVASHIYFHFKKE